MGKRREVCYFFQATQVPCRFPATESHDHPQRQQQTAYALLSIFCYARMHDRTESTSFFAAFPGPFSNCWLTEYADEEYTKFAFEQFWTALPANYISVRFSANVLGAMALAYDADDYGISRAELTGAISAEASQELFTSWSQQLFTQIRPLAGVSERHLQAYWIQDSSGSDSDSASFADGNDVSNVSKVSGRLFLFFSQDVALLLTSQNSRTNTDAHAESSASVADAAAGSQLFQLLYQASKPP